jgi:hypothetical protein
MEWPNFRSATHRKRVLNSQLPLLFAGALYRSNSYLHHTGNFCGGNSRLEHFQCSTPELRQLSLPAGFEPATVDSMYLAPAPRRKLQKSAHTPAIRSANPNRSAPQVARDLACARRTAHAEKIPGGILVHGLWASNPSLTAPVNEVPVNSTIPGNTSPAWRALLRFEFSGLS